MRRLWWMRRLVDASPERRQRPSFEMFEQIAEFHFIHLVLTFQSASVSDRVTSRTL
jgi:hypothetical protein